MPKGKDIRHEGEFFSSTVAREQRICPGEDKANFISILQLLAALSEALRLLKNSEQLLFIHMHLSWTTRKPKANTNTPPHPCSRRAAQLLLQDTECARAGLRGRLSRLENGRNWQPLSCLTGLHGSARCEKGGFCELPLG